MRETSVSCLISVIPTVVMSSVSETSAPLDTARSVSGVAGLVFRPKRRLRRRVLRTGIPLRCLASSE